ncbi:hypothetical protein WQQ_20220 [Hydrocarboniphaga effusa AP103]|uniref:Uncharacterized protein n=1 Tax=Hydrocarboniphaga effusa AP103 TaxID=1172194 RepID=I8TD27_9GAMM|nr:hypothetical protein WQQ_20220 [Hydrocarboniphaga effusa AP103]
MFDAGHFQPANPDFAFEVGLGVVSRLLRAKPAVIEMGKLSVKAVRESFRGGSAMQYS